MYRNYHIRHTLILIMHKGLFTFFAVVVSLANLTCHAAEPKRLADPAQTVEPSAAQTNDASTKDNAHQSAQWYDRWQDKFSQSMNSTALQLDNFFANTSYVDAANFQQHQTDQDGTQQARASGYIRYGWEPRSRALDDQDVRFRVRVRLPALQDRIELLLSDSEDDDLPDTLGASRASFNDDAEQTNLALQYTQSPDAKVRYRVGAGRRDQLYVQTRYTDSLMLNEELSVFYDAEMYYYTRNQFGSELGATLQYVHHEKAVSRFKHRFYYRDDRQQWSMLQELQYLHALDERSAGITRLHLRSIGIEKAMVDEVYTSFRWRTNYLRKWLFFDVEPFVIWLRSEDFAPSYGVALRVEAHYGH